MIPVPEITGLDTAFGNINHMPKYSDIPDDFYRKNQKYVDFVSSWFFGGKSKEEIARLTPKEGVDKNKALAAIKAILCSFEPKHEHKEAGAAFLLAEWFDLADEAKAA